MKVLIVDDEKHVREAIILLVPWENYNISKVLESQNVEDAKKLILAEKPELIFLDMMLMNQTGVDLLSWLHESSIPSKVIVVSGYNDFHFVRNAMRYNGVDYLLKPIDQEEIITALQKAIKALQEDQLKHLENQTKNFGNKQIDPLYLDKALSDYIKDPRKYSTILQEINNKVDGSRGMIQIALLSFQLIHWRIYNKFSTNQDLLFLSVKNICNEYLSRYGCGYAFRDWNNENEIVILFWSHIDNSKQILAEINDKILKVLGSRFFISVGNSYKLPLGASLSYENSRKVLHDKFNLKRTTSFIFDDSHPNFKEQETIYINQFGEKLHFAMKFKNDSLIQSVTNSIINELQILKVITLNHIEIWQNELNILKLKYFDKGYSDQLNRMDLKISYILMNDNGELLIDDWLEKLKGSLILLHQIISNYNQERVNVIEEIADFIEKYYYEDLSLQYFSDHFFLSREHISRKFKQEYRTNLHDFITGVRMEKAKELLSDPDLRVSDVSKMVGYEDEKYFSKAFRKSIGYTPSQYRDHTLSRIKPKIIIEKSIK